MAAETLKRNEGNQMTIRAMMRIDLFVPQIVGPIFSIRVEVIENHHVEIVKNNEMARATQALELDESDWHSHRRQARLCVRRNASIS